MLYQYNVKIEFFIEVEKNQVNAAVKFDTLKALEISLEIIFSLIILSVETNNSLKNNNRTII